MAVFKCKMCGAPLEIGAGASTACCDYCGSEQTIPKISGDKLERLHDRANHFRRNDEFDKAIGIYEQILEEDNTDSEVYWSLVLCKYGIKYVEDPASRQRIPTVNRAQYTSIFDDDNYKLAIKYSDISQKILYEKEARAINEIQKGILEISQKEEPFDIFICYKETGADGQRTRDSVYANDLYHELTKEGLKVFFARITLEDKLGVAYEPYIFAALNSSKIMVVLGTKPEHFNAVWVKNEWSRYLSLIKSGAKKTLIPAYFGMDPYDLPEEFSHLQALDMSKLGFMSDLIRGIKKIIELDTPKPTVTNVTYTQTVAASSSASGGDVEKMLKRAEIYMRDSDWTNADIYCEKALDEDPECGKAYLYKLLVKNRVNSIKNLQIFATRVVSGEPAYKNAMMYLPDEEADELAKCNQEIAVRLRKAAEEEAKRKALAEEERQKQIRRQMERKKLTDARDKAMANVENISTSKRQVGQALYSAKNADSSQNKLIVKRAVSTLIWLGMIIFAIILVAISTTQGLEGVGELVFGVLLIVFGIIGYFIAGGRLETACGRNPLYSAANIFYLAYSLVRSIQAIKSVKNQKKNSASDIAKYEAQLVRIEKDLDSAREALLTINKRIEAFDRGENV